ncbi:MAG: ComEC/Rec2 family competence protein [Candidatus Aureabacteria bacterium]|nr:ComEC/Rec2 family competence protein [Candidatus Auribacterota bacterium]
MQAYIISFCVYLCAGIVMRLLHPENLHLDLAYLIAAGFLIAAAAASLLYRIRILAHLFLTAAICVAFIALPLDNGLNYYFMGVFSGLLLLAIVLGFLKFNGLAPSMLSALFLGYGITCLYTDLSSPTHLIHWATDNFEKSLVYGTIVKEPEIRPEARRTELSIDPSVVIHLRGPESKARVEQILAILKDLKRQWPDEGIALATLYQAKDALAAHPDRDRDEIIRKTFSAGGYQPGEQELRNIGMALDELAQVEGSRITKGWIVARIFERTEHYLDLSYPTAYGDAVKIEASLRQPFPATNPGGFDYRRMLTNSNYFATMSISSGGRGQEPDSITIIDSRRGNPFTSTCIAIKYKLLEIIRQTTPFPDSCFMSGIFLGLRRGVTEKIMKDSQAAGTAHVFAVSGLHVTIITGLILLLFSQTPIPRTVWAPITVVLLFVFTTITGNRPSALRAAIMNSFALIFYTYFGKNIQRSLIMAICVAAIIILVILPSGYGGPLILPEASFLMSFSAVIFLSWMSNPVEQFFNTRLTSLFRFILFAFIVVLAGLYFMNMENLPAILGYPIFWILAVALPLSYFLQRYLPFRPRFTAIPSSWLRTFLAAQVAIQCAMIPLSVMIFHRMSLAAPFANLIAIPLIGIVLPLGFLATLLALIPGIGMQLALLLTAGNWLGMRFFIILDDLSTRIFPYPQVPKPGPVALIVFYSLIVAFIYREKIALRLKIAYYQVKNALPTPGTRVRLLASLAALTVAVVTLTMGIAASHKPLLTVTFLDLSFPARGMSAMIETPDGKNILVDVGFEGKWGSFNKRLVNQGERGLQEVLLRKNLVNFAAVVNSNFDATLMGGLNFIVGSPDYYIKKIFSYLPPEEFGPQNIDVNRFAQALTPRGRKNAPTLYRQILLGNWNDPVSVTDCMDYFHAIPPAELTAFLATLDDKNRSAAEAALAGLDKAEGESREVLFESIISTYGKLGETVDRAKAEEIAGRWRLPLLTVEEYRQFITDFPGPLLWFVYQKAGVVASVADIASYMDELRLKFEEAARESKSVYRADEKFLQCHRLIYYAREKNIPMSAASFGMNIVEPKTIRGKNLEMTVLNPPAERFRGTYVSDSNSIVLHIRYGKVSLLLTSLINQKASEWLLGLKGGIQSTIYQVPEFGLADAT